MSVPRCLSNVSGRLRLVLGAFAFSVVIVSQDADANVMLDQEHTFAISFAESTNGTGSEVGQTFTVGLTGTLDHIDVWLFRLGGIFDPNGDPTLHVYDTDDGLPAGTSLATVTVPEAVVAFNNATFVTFDVSSAAIDVTAGDLLAFGISTTSSNPYFLPAHSDTGQAGDYTEGEGVHRSLSPGGPWMAFSDASAEDLGFRTYVDTIPMFDNPGDENEDHIVDLADLNNVKNYFGDSGAVGPDGNGIPGDENEDGEVDLADLNNVKNYFGNDYSSPLPSGLGSLIVPEPASVAMFALVAGFVFIRRR